MWSVKYIEALETGKRYGLQNNGGEEKSRELVRDPHDAVSICSYARDHQLPGDFHNDLLRP